MVYVIHPLQYLLMSVDRLMILCIMLFWVPCSPSVNLGKADGIEIKSLNLIQNLSASGVSSALNYNDDFSMVFNNTPTIALSIRRITTQQPTINSNHLETCIIDVSSSITTLSLSLTTSEFISTAQFDVRYLAVDTSILLCFQIQSHFLPGPYTDSNQIQAFPFTPPLFSTTAPLVYICLYNYQHQYSNGFHNQFQMSVGVSTGLNAYIVYVKENSFQVATSNLKFSVILYFPLLLPTNPPFVYSSDYQEFSSSNTFSSYQNNVQLSNFLGVSFIVKVLNTSGSFTVSGTSGNIHIIGGVNRIGVFYISFGIKFCTGNQIYYKPPSLPQTPDSERCVNQCPPGTSCIPNVYSAANKICIQCPHFCQNCSLTTSCDICSPNTQNPSGVCACMTNYYSLDNIICKKCPPGCQTCTAYSMCTLCDFLNKFTLATTYCECQPYSLLETPERCVCVDNAYNTPNNQCQPCDPSCLTCSGPSATDCDLCSLSNYRVKNGNICQCQHNFTDVGCTQAGICCIKVQLDFAIQSLIKDQSSNALIYTISIHPQLEGIYKQNFVNVVDLGLPTGTQMECSYSNGTLTVRATYALNLQGLQTALTVDMSKIGNSFFGVQPFTMKYTVIPADNLAANVYSAATYASVKPLTAASYCVVGLAFVVFLAGLHSSKVVVTEMMGVVQLAFFGLFVLDGTDPLLTSLAPLRFSNGYNDILGALGTEALDSAALQASSRIRAAGFSASVLRNFNTTLALAVLPLLVALVLFLMSKQQHRRNRKALDSLSKNVLGQWTMLALLFGLLNFASSLGVFCQLGRPSGWAFYGDVVAAVLFAAMLAANLALYATTDFNVFGEFKYYFAWGDFESRFYFVHCAFRLAAGMLLGLGNSSYISGAAVLLLLMVVALVVSAKQPYADLPQNIRCLVNLVVSVVIMAFYTAMSAYGPSRTPTSFYVQIPVVIVGLLLAVVVMAAGFVVKEIVKNVKSPQSFDQSAPKDVEDDERQQNNFLQQKIQEGRSEGNYSMAKRLMMMKKKKQKKPKMKPLDVAVVPGEVERETGLTVQKFMEVDRMLQDGFL